MTLTVTAASDVFDQDLEDMSPEIREGIVNGEGKKPPIQPPQEKKAESGDPATEPQVKKINAMIAGLGYKKDDERHKVASSFLAREIKSMNDLTKVEAMKLIDHLEKAAKEAAKDELPL